MKPRRHQPQPGFTLLEQLIAISLGALVCAGCLAVTMSLTATVQEQQAHSAMQQAARFAERRLRNAFEPAGYHPQPWQPAQEPAVFYAFNSTPPDSDQIAVQRWSQRNCLGNDNPDRDNQGQPAWYLLQQRFMVRPDGRLAETCHFGPAQGPSKRQLNAATLVSGVETLQILLAEDTNGDGLSNRWVAPGQWQHEAAIVGIHFALLLRSELPLNGAPLSWLLAGQPWSAPDDQHVRLLAATSVPLRGRLP